MKIRFAPSVYEHAAFLIGETPWRVSRDPGLMYESHKTAHDLYGHSPVVVGIDIYNLEAEAYGAVIEEPRGTGIPAIKQPLFSSLDDALEIRPFDPRHDGRIAEILACGRKLAGELEEAQVCIPVSGPFSIATNLRGVDGILIDLATRPGDVGRFLERLVDGQLLFCEEILDSGLDIALFESAAAPPLVAPSQFAAVELPVMKRMMSVIEERFGLKLPFIIGGDTAPVLENIVSTGTSFVICPAETDRDAFMKKISSYPEVAVRVNLPPYLVEQGPVDRIFKEVDAILELKGSVPNEVLLGTGAVPYSTPREHILAIKEYVS